MSSAARWCPPAVLLWLVAGAAAAFSDLAPAVAGETSAGAPPRRPWSFLIASGYDSYVQRYPLADGDTTETISELDLVLGAERRAPAAADHRWSLRSQVAIGTEMIREQLEGNYEYRSGGQTRLRVGGAWLGRQFRSGTRYSLSSDHAEGRLDGRWFVMPAGAVRGEMRAHAGRLRHQRPTPLQIDHDEAGVGADLRAGIDAERLWSFGLRLSRRAHPDSAALDRTAAAAEVAWDTGLSDRNGLRLRHRSERRAVRDQSARPSAWSHGSEAAASIPAGPGRIAVEARSEVWRYDAERSVYFDSWRLAGALLYRGGAVLGPAWQAGLALETLAAGSDSPENYRQAGLRAGVELLQGALTGLCTLEVGWRDYTSQPATAADDPLLLSYSDFTYWELWLLAVWSLTPHLSLDVIANYLPERHVEPTDDAAMGFASARLAWRW